MNQRPYIFLNSHRGWLFYSGLVKAKNDFFLGSGTQSFRIRDEIYDGKVRVRGRTETHNSLLSIFVDYGFLGLALYLFFYLFLYIKILKKKNLKITNYDISCIIYLSSLLLTFNFINIEYTLSIWLLNGICLSRALSK